MELSTTSGFLSDHLIKALGNTLVNSLWQGLVVAIAAGLIIVFTKNRRAALRYSLLVGVLILFACATLITFIDQLLANETINTASVYAVSPGVNQPGDMQPQSVAITGVAANNIPGMLMDFLNNHYNVIVLIWFLIICIKSVRFAAGIQEIYHLRNTKVNTAGKYWETRLLQLSVGLHIKQTIRLMESGIAKMPMVIGHLKPLILIPVGFINALPADEVEAILVHELAHIRRKDYLVNLLQSFMEIVFFFNPAVMWISQLIKAERENCCDDIALSQAGSKANYIQALLSCHEHQLSQPALSMALAGNKSKLLNRVKRIVNNHNQSLNIMEKTLLTICLVSAGLFTVAFSAKERDKKLPAKTSGLTIVHTQPMNMVSLQNDTAVDKHIKIYRPEDFDDGTTMHTIDRKNGKFQSAYLFKRKGTLYQVNMDKGQVGSLLVDGKTTSVNQYRTKIDGLLNEYKKIANPPAPAIPPVPATRVKSTPA
ncbi:MAG: M56 family metallopeptidase [Mucilaginibacter sp.]